MQPIKGVINTNQMESLFSRIRRGEGLHHSIAGRYLVRYAHDLAWRENTRRRDDRTRGLSRSRRRPASPAIQIVRWILASPWRKPLRQAHGRLLRQLPVNGVQDAGQDRNDTAWPARHSFLQPGKMKISADILKRAGEALYGERWQSPLSRDLGVTDRTIRNWAANRNECPGDLAERLLQVLRARGECVETVTVRIKACVDDDKRSSGERRMRQ
jgi:hypothetical protein